MNDTGNCNKSKFKPPVAWLLGRELLAGLKLIAAYTFMGDKQDPKDWMKAEVIQGPQKDPGINLIASKLNNFQTIMKFALGCIRNHAFPSFNFFRLMTIKV